MGCLATHIAGHHPVTADLSIDAGIAWLTRVAGLNPATSNVIRAWDCGSAYDWELRSGLLVACREERERRRIRRPAPTVEEQSCELVFA